MKPEESSLTLPTIVLDPISVPGNGRHSYLLVVLLLVVFESLV